MGYRGKTFQGEEATSAKTLKQECPFLVFEERKELARR